MEIHCDGLFVALVHQERGDGLFDVELSVNSQLNSARCQTFELDGLIAAFETARRRLTVNTEQPPDG